MNKSEQTKRKMVDEADSPRKHPKLSDALRFHPRPQSSSQTPSIITNHYRTYTARQVMDFNAMTTYEREEHYEALFDKHNEPLRYLEWPLLASEYPNLAAEINAAFFRYTTFTVEVWMNYDTAAKRFFHDARAQDCGRIRLPSKLVNLHLAKYEYAKVRFEVCTPFTRLATVVIAVEPTQLNVGVRIKSVKRGFTNEDDMLVKGVSTAINKIRVDVELRGRTGLDFEDMVAVAREFRIAPSEGAFTHGGWLRNTDVWMNLRRHGEENTGYVYGIDDEVEVESMVMEPRPISAVQRGAQQADSES